MDIIIGRKYSRRNGAVKVVVDDFEYDKVRYHEMGYPNPRECTAKQFEDMFCSENLDASRRVTELQAIIPEARRQISNLAAGISKADLGDRSFLGSITEHVRNLSEWIDEYNELKLQLKLE